MRTAAPSPEFLLLAACCRWPTDPAAVTAAAQGGIDWPRLVALTRRHRVAGLVRRGLIAAGIDPPAAITQSCRQAVARNLLLLREAGRIAALLADAGIAAVFLKGPTLAAQAYADVGVKQTLDNDLLVSWPDTPAVIGIIEGAGYRLADPPVILDRKRLSVLASLVKECGFVHRANRALLDLHWRASSLRGLLREPDLVADAETVAIDGVAIPTLRANALMVYLAVHGARHGWARLKWLADFNALLVAMDERAVVAMRARARRDGVTRCMDLALVQAGRLFGTAVPPDAARSCRVRWLARLSDELMRGPNEIAEQAEVPGRYMAAGFASTILLSVRPRYLLDALWTVWVAPRDALAIPLSLPLRPLYLAIGLACRIGRLVSRRLARARSTSMREMEL